jgi:hypothetical protein
VRAIISQEFDYILEADRVPDGETDPDRIAAIKADQTVFHLRRLTARERASLEDGVAIGDQSANFSFRTGSQALDAVRAGLLGWDNMLSGGDSRETIEFRRQRKTLNILGANNSNVPEPAMLDYIVDHITELANAIVEGSTATVEQLGN